MPTPLEILLDTLRNEPRRDWPNDDAPLHDWTTLPVFGGSEPSGRYDGAVWSWDEGHVLIGTCARDLRIVKR